MRDLPGSGWAVIGAMVLFAAVVLGVLYWAQFTGRAGSQRGLVIHNELDGPVVVAIGDSEERRIEAGHEQTFVVKREQFPAQIRAAVGAPVSDVVIAAEIFEYRDLVDAEFRLSIDANGIYRTTEVRDTPVPATEAP